jgi:hypothetical protein
MPSHEESLRMRPSERQSRKYTARLESAVVSHSSAMAAWVRVCLAKKASVKGACGVNPTLRSACAENRPTSV